MQPGIAWISRGRLILKPSGQPPREVESPFARQTVERQIRNQQLHGWKERSGLWGNMGMAPPDWNQWNDLGPRRLARFAAIAPGGAGRLMYVLDLGDVGGLFDYDSAAEQERRLMHRNGFRARDLARHPQRGLVAVSVMREDGTAGIVVGENDGRFLSDTTLGDSIDEAPAWIPGEDRRIVFQSAGIARNEAGFPLGLTPYRIELLDLERGQIETVLEEEARDLLQPRLLADGTLYYIRRLYLPLGRERPDALTQFKDIVLFPFRLLRAVFHFLNFFSIMFSGKPLTTAGGPAQQAPESRYLMLWGHMIDAKRAIQRAGREKTPDLVPQDWQLVRRSPAGTEEVLAESVLSYDVCPSGDVIYTNGSRIVHLDGDGGREEVGTDRMIGRVIALE